jgi:hypothetical protein
VAVEKEETPLTKFQLSTRRLLRLITSTFKHRRFLFALSVKVAGEASIFTGDYDRRP